MPTFLHDLSALQSLADGPAGPARDWANVRLALREPQQVLHLPDGAREALWVLASGAELPRRQLLERLRESLHGRRDPALGVLLDSASALGLLPTAEPEPWVEALRALWPAADEPTQIVAAEMLADLGVFEEALLSKLSKSDSYEGQVSASALVLRWMAHHDRPLQDLAAQVARGLLPLARAAPTVLSEVLLRLGLPLFEPGLELADAAKLGATLAYGAAPEIPKSGSARSRLRRYVRQALADRKDPAAQLLLALVELEVPDPAELAAVAAWCSHDPRERYGPVQAVLFGAGEDRALLSAARQGLRTAETPLVAIQTLGARLVSNPVLALVPALPAPMRQDEELLPAAIDHRLMTYEDQLAKTVLPYAISYDKLPDEITSGEPMALARAAFAQTEEVLVALLAREPEGEDERVALGTALAQQGDAAAFDRLLQLADGHEALREAVRSGGLLLGRPS